MKKLNFFLVLAIILTACQREVDTILRETEADEVIPMMRVVQVDNGSPAQDSVVRILKTVILNGEKTVELTEFYSDFADTLRWVFSYNPSGNLSTIKVFETTHPATILANHKFTWSGSRLAKVITDTLGVFAESIELIYTPSGGNTLISSVEIPSRDNIQPDHTTRIKHTLLMNGLFQVINEKYFTHVWVDNGGSVTNVHDSVTLAYTYSANDVTRYDHVFSRHDTAGPNTNLTRDTGSAVFGRSPSGINVADSLKKIFGTDLYTLMHFQKMELYYYWPVLFSPLENYKHFLSRPLMELFHSRRSWYNGAFDPMSSYTNVQEKKNVNSFDGQGRLTKMEVYDDFTFGAVIRTYKISY
jgi:hypothetical protein